LAAEDDYKLREQQLMERIQNVDPAWLEEDSIPQSIQFMIDLIPTIRTLLKGWPTWKTLSVLDVGAASGAASNLLATMYREHFFDVKMKVDALDIEPKFKAYADSHFPNIRYLIGDIYKFDNSNVWDLIICSHTLEHIPDYRRFLTELQRRARYWVLVYVPYEEKSLIPIHHNSFTEKTVKSLQPMMLQVLESPAWKAPVEKKDEVRKCILFVMKGFASQKPIIQSPKAQEKIKGIQTLVDNKEYDNAIREIEELLKSWPTDGRLNYLLGFCLQSLNKEPQKSLAFYDLALKYGYDEYWVKYHRGILYMKLGELQKASLDLERALALKPWDDGAHLVLKETKQKILENDGQEKSQNINLGHQKTIEEKDNQIIQITETSKAMDMELRNLRASIVAIQNSITWRTLTPLKIRYDAIFHRLNNNNKTKSGSLQTAATARAVTLMQTTAGEQTIKTIVPQRLEDKKDIVCFPITDWSFRYQRSNHLLSKFANNGHRIFYLTVNLYSENTPYSVTNITDNIFEVKLNCIRHFNIYNDILDKETTESLLLSSQKMQEELEISAFSFIVFPSWARLVLALKQKYGWPIIYDCLDDYYGFGNVNKAGIDEELNLFRNSDLVLTTSSFLYKKARKITDKTLYIPNAGEFDHFKQPTQNDLLKNIKKPIAGYYGAIADWFDNETIEYVATRRPDVNFVFIGHTFGSNIATLEKLSNVHFLGEKPYRELPLYLYHFDVCLIPFKPTPLIEATHPVKFYEYLASGKPVISTRLTELIQFGNLCYLSSDKEEFLINLDMALVENDPQMVSRRIEFASKNTWENRFSFLYPEVKTILSG
jgi:glycosyltransferase involved in cell wall biosynthesis/SAM-dependent methyltransferase